MAFCCYFVSKQSFPRNTVNSSRAQTPGPAMRRAEPGTQQPVEHSLLSCGAAGTLASVQLTQVPPDAVLFPLCPVACSLAVRRTQHMFSEHQTVPGAASLTTALFDRRDHPVGLFLHRPVLLPADPRLSPNVQSMWGRAVSAAVVTARWALTRGCCLRGGGQGAG